jgi:hypothetical protein
MLKPKIYIRADANSENGIIDAFVELKILIRSFEILPKYNNLCTKPPYYS